LVCTRVSGARHVNCSDRPGLAMSFRDWQPQYAAHGIATFPVAIGRDGKKPLVSNYARFGRRASMEIAEKFPYATGIGFMLGTSSRLTVLDVDSPDRVLLANALDRHGPTSVIARTGSGNYQAWYRHNGEGRLIRPEPDKPIDILGSGVVVAPPSRGINRNYEFIHGGLDDLDRLPVLRGLPEDIRHKEAAIHEAPITRIAEGNRNNSLFRHCMSGANHCDDFHALLDVARTRNAEFSPPLLDDEVVKIAHQAWGYTERGENRFGRPGVFFAAAQVNELICSDPDLYLLLSFLRANNKPNSHFMATNQGLAKIFHWRPRRVAAARRRMIEKGYVIQTRPARTKQPALYYWRKGGPK
jgi:hypothetical protein